MNLHLIDSTLREGLQAPGGSIFRDTESMPDYIDEVSGLNLIDRFEVYMPGPNISNEIWRAIMSTHRDKIQVYVGPAHRFDINERKELLGAAWSMISTTLIRKDQESLVRLPEISETTNNSPIRVGVECAGELDPAQTLELVQTLGSTTGVAVVSINDSNSRMDMRWIDSFIDELANQVNAGVPRLGFHLHNGEIAALTKAERLTEALRSIGLNDVELDVTAFGFADRLGLLSVSEAICLSSDFGGSPAVEEYEKIANELLRERTIEASPTPDKAASHYDEQGELRLEYLLHY